MGNTAEIIDDLRVIPCMSHLREHELYILGNGVQIREYSKNDILFKESDQIKYFFMVRRGSVKLYKTSPDGKEMIINIIRQNDHFCCAPLCIGDKSFVNAVVLEDSLLLLIPAKNFKEILAGSMGEMGLRVVSGLCGKIRHLSKLVGDLTFKDVEQRVTEALLKCAEEKSSSGNIVQLTLSHQEIASMTGTVREVVSRTIAKLKKDRSIIDSSVKGFKVDKKKLINRLVV